MGTLVAMRYPTNMFLGLADHTYVQCGTGAKAWACWGGKTGGAVLRHGSGSTKRADSIAGVKERAGITCYLVNGVCHQAANRILLPAGILVSGARGYGISSALFGTYGRPRGPLGLCKAPFDQHADVSGDLPACIGEAADSALRTMRANADSRETAFIGDVLGLYRSTGADALQGSRNDAVPFMLEHARVFASYRLGGMAERAIKQVVDAQQRFEERRARIENGFSNRDVSPTGFAAEINSATIDYQDALADALPPEQFRALFSLEPTERVILADPDIMAREYGR